MKKKPATKRTAPCQLETLITEFIAAEKAFLLPSPRPKEPVQKKAYTSKEWAQYQKDLATHKVKIERYKEKLTLLRQSFVKSYESVLKFIPKSQEWFVTENKRFAVALQTPSWPMDPTRILCRENPVIEELPKIKRY